MPKTLLIVDDSPLIRRMILDVLKQDFATVNQAQDGQEAVELARSTTPDLVLMDLEMPRMNGIEACRQMRTIGTLADVPIVMLTSRGGESDMQMALEAGATDYLVNPFAPGLLRARLRTWVLRGAVT